MTLDPNEALKARRLARLREELGYLLNDEDPGTSSWRQAMIDGRMLELKELGIFDQNDFDAFNAEYTDALWAKKMAES